MACFVTEFEIVYILHGGVAMEGFIKSLKSPVRNAGAWIWLARVGMLAAGIFIGTYCFSVVKQSLKTKGTGFFSKLVRIIIWLAVLVGANICVYKLLNAYTLFFFIGCVIALITSLFTKF